MTDPSTLPNAAPTPTPTWRVWLALARPAHWVKNLLLFLPPLFAHMPISSAVFGDLAVGFACMCLAASAGYIVNDIRDAGHDRRHQRKRSRPIAMGLVRPRQAAAAAAVIALLAVLLAAVVLGRTVTAMVVAYLALSVVYSCWLKAIIGADVVVLTGLFVWRMAIGGEIVGIELSAWLVTLAVNLFLTLALLKRIDDLAPLRATGGTAPGRGYDAGHRRLLVGLACLFGVAAVATLIAYLLWSGAAEAYYRNAMALWLAAAAFCLWLARVGRSALRGRLGGDPVIFAATDPTCLVLAAAAVACYLAAI